MDLKLILLKTFLVILEKKVTAWPCGSRLSHHQQLRLWLCTYILEAGKPASAEYFDWVGPSTACYKGALKDNNTNSHTSFFCGCWCNLFSTPLLLPSKNIHDVYKKVLCIIIIIGSAEALPILCVRYIRWERERDTERERERRKWRHHCRAKIGVEFCTSPCQKCAP